MVDLIVNFANAAAFKPCPTARRIPVKQPPIPKPLLDAVDALDVLLTATAVHGYTPPGPAWDEGLRALSAARALTGPRIEIGTWIMSIDGEEAEDPGGERHTGPYALGQVEEQFLSGEGRLEFSVAFKTSGVWLFTGMDTLRDTARFKVLTDPWEIIARQNGWHAGVRSVDGGLLVVKANGDDGTYLSWLDCCVGENYTVKP